MREKLNLFECWWNPANRNILKILVTEGIIDRKMSLESTEMDAIQRTYGVLFLAQEKVWKTKLHLPLQLLAKVKNGEPDFQWSIKLQQFQLLHSPWYHVDWKPENDFSQISNHHNARLDSTIKRYLHNIYRLEALIVFQKDRSAKSRK